jgi:hypothetical protein
MGTLASPNHSYTTTSTTTSPFRLNHHSSATPAPTHVPMRRQLSGGQLEEFLWNQNNNNHVSTSDGTDSFADHNRPRSMSF